MKDPKANTECRCVCHHELHKGQPCCEAAICKHCSKFMIRTKPMTNSNKTVEWEERFDAKFGVNSIYPIEVKHFIRQLLELRDKQLREDKCWKCKLWHDHGHQIGGK